MYKPTQWKHVFTMLEKLSGDWRCLSWGATAQSYFQLFLKVRHLWICWGSIQSGAEGISIEEVILKPRISENWSVSGAGYIRGALVQTNTHQHLKCHILYVHKHTNTLKRGEKRETLKLVHNPDLLQCLTLSETQKTWIYCTALHTHYLVCSYCSFVYAFCVCCNVLGPTKMIEMEKVPKQMYLLNKNKLR